MRPVAAAVGLLCLSVHVMAQSPTIELRGDGYILRGSLTPGQLTAVACDLETAARALGFPQRDQAAPTVVAVDSTRAIGEWLPQLQGRKSANPLGAYWNGLYGHHIVVRVDAQPEERFRRVLHEYAHYMTHATDPDPPRWLDEGLSELWEHAAITRHSIELGQPVAEHLKRLRSGSDWLPVQDLVSATAIPAGNTATSMFYAQSWALVHYLMPNRAPKDADLPTGEALKEYVRGPMVNRTVISSGGPGQPDCSVERPFRAVPPLEALIGRAQALADGERSVAALPVLQEALQFDPTNVEALETLAFVHFTGNRPAEAAAIFDRLIAAGKASHISFYYRAVLAEPVPGRTDDGPIPVHEYLQKALALKPGFAPAIQRLKELAGKGRL